MQVHTVPKAQLLQLLGEKNRGNEEEGAARSLPVPRHRAAQLRVAHQSHTALGRWKQDQEFEVILSYIEKLKAALAT